MLPGGAAKPPYAALPPCTAVDTRATANASQTTSTFPCALLRAAAKTAMTIRNHDQTTFDPGAESDKLSHEPTASAMGVA